ncbi:hypothetical protein ACWEVD_12960 [Nocardia thailandica]|uniref:YCII-related domain-containing protein n=1 Tax=Nocardia thailandica TaxID=257275 RepID=A0ABW6PGF1_9NOCA|nr:hypothetical protein [Nocardia thailandica]
MYAHLLHFDRPRSAEELAAGDFAVEHRIRPLLAGVPGLLEYIELRRDDGTGVVIGLAESESALSAARDAVMGSALLPGEDPALLPGPDRVEIYPVRDHADTAAIYAAGGAR